MREYKTAYYEKLAEAGLSSVWLDKIISGGSRSRGLFLTPERIPLTFIVQLSYTAKIPLEKCIEVLWQHNIKESKYFSNTAYKNAIPVVVPPSMVSLTRTVLKPYSKWYPPHLRGGLFAQLVYERKYRATDLDKFMGFPEGGMFHWLRKPYTISRVQDFIKLAAFMGTDFNGALDYFLMIKTEKVNIPLVLPIRKNRSRSNTLGSMTTFDMLRLLKDLKQL